MADAKERDLDRKHQEDLVRIRNFRLMDDDFMSKVFEDTACAEFLLKVILNRDDLTVQEVHGQHDIRDARSGWIFWQWTRKIEHTTLKSSGATVVQAQSGHAITAAFWMPI